jgi:hypothetical protein
MVNIFQYGIKGELPRSLQSIKSTSDSLQSIEGSIFQRRYDEIQHGVREELPYCTKDTKKGASRSMDITTRPMIEKENEAVALATVIFAAGFFLGIGTGMLLGSSSGSGVRGRLREVVDHLLGDATKGLTNVIEIGSGMLTKGHMSDHA